MNDRSILDKQLSLWDNISTDPSIQNDIRLRPESTNDIRIITSIDIRLR